MLKVIVCDHEKLCSYFSLVIDTLLGSCAVHYFVKTEREKEKKKKRSSVWVVMLPCPKYSLGLMGSASGPWVVMLPCPKYSLGLMGSASGPWVVMLPCPKYSLGLMGSFE